MMNVIQGFIKSRGSLFGETPDLKGGENFILARDPSQFQYDDVPQMLHLPHVPLAKVDRNQVCTYVQFNVCHPTTLIFYAKEI